MLNKSKYPLMGLVFSLIVSATPALAYAESILQVLPTRAVLDGNKRSINITLINRGDQAGSYRLFFRNIRADENGKFAEVDTAVEGELFADNMVRYSPRRITVPARSKQTVRLVVRKPPQLESGEYRSHLVFRKLPAQNSVLEKQTEENELGFSLRPIVEVTIPVIIRHGELSANVSLANASIRSSENGKTLSFEIDRVGSRSLYGDVDAWLITQNGEKRNIGMARGIAVYTPNTKRKFQLPLENIAEANDEGEVVLEFREDPSYGGNLQDSIRTPL